MAKKTKVEETFPGDAVNLREYLAKHRHPLLCLGPMSKNSVDAVIKYSSVVQQPIPIICSRRQIECEEQGGGYVNNWNTRTFAKYVRDRSRANTPLCRDHGGPWQGSNEAGLSRDEAMKTAKQSLLEDISAGFDVLHLDPSIQNAGLLHPDTLQMLFELYAFVCQTAMRLGRTIEIEVGAEQQSGYISEAEELVSFLKEVTSFCEEEKFQRPLFCVVQTGTLVKEMRNIGMTEGRRNEAFDLKYAVETMEKRVRHLVDIAYINSVYVKEHNGDYLSDGSMALRRQLGVGGVNVAPELGVCESKRLISFGYEMGVPEVSERLLEIFYQSMKWEKWMSSASKATDVDKALIAGHYTFGTPEFAEQKAKLMRAGKKAGVDLDTVILDSLVSYIQRMAWCLGYLHSKTEQRKAIKPVNRHVSVEQRAST